MFLGGADVEYHILAVGDVVGDSGIAHLSKHLRALKKLKSIDFTVVNGENAAGVGLFPAQADDIFAAGADVITLGNHAFGKDKILPYLDENGYILRPANYSPRMPGRGDGVFDCGRARVRVINLIGRCNLGWNCDSPFAAADALLARGERADFTLVDFHAEATSEKAALAYFLDGRVAAVWGTHTHVPTADERVFPKGTGFISDVGMTGPVDSVIGVPPEQSVEGFLGGMAGRFRVAEGRCALRGAIFTIDGGDGLCRGVERIEII
jgi:metallophosphoesterase (TIGR00282 family)